MESTAYGKTDYLFAWIYLLIGYGFVFTVLSGDYDRRLAVYTILYIAVVMLYVMGKGVRPGRESYFWMCILLGTAVPFAFWSVMPFIQTIAVILLAAYWTLHVTGSLLDGFRTSQWVAMDCINALLVVPFANFTCLFTALCGGGGEEEKEHKNGGRIGAVLLGLVIAVPLFMVALPLLSSADAGFQSLAARGVSYVQEHFLLTIIRMILSVPVTAYLFGLIYGGLHKRNTGHIEKESILKAGRAVRLISNVTVCTAVLAVCAVYFLFMIIQGKYLFSAFTGTMPQNFTYAEYARRGFFELCGIAVFNLMILFGANLFSKAERYKSSFLRAVNILLAVLTLLLIITAMSKMIMYIGVFGLTVKRILTMAFMIWLTIVFSFVIVWQKREFPIVRICVMAGAVIFCLMCVLPVERCTVIRFKV